MCPREHQTVVIHAISSISLKLCQFKGSTPKLKITSWFLLWLFPGGDRPPSGFFRFSLKKWPQNRSNVRSSYCNCNYCDGLCTYDTSFNRFDWRLVNQQVNKLVCFYTFKYLVTLRSNISPCQKATTLIWTPLSSPLFHLDRKSVV